MCIVQSFSVDFICQLEVCVSAYACNKILNRTFLERNVMKFHTLGHGYRVGKCLSTTICELHIRCVCVNIRECVHWANTMCSAATYKLHVGGFVDSVFMFQLRFGISMVWTCAVEYAHSMFFIELLMQKQAYTTQARPVIISYIFFLFSHPHLPRIHIEQQRRR